MVDLLRDSTTFRAVYMEGYRKGYREGRLNGARKAIMIWGTQRFGPPNPKVVQSLESISTFKRLERIALAVLDVESWSELLAADDR